MSEKVELKVETVKLIQKEMRNLQVLNMELRSQLSAVGRILNTATMHMPSEREVEYVPESIAILNKEIETSLKKQNELQPIDLAKEIAETPKPPKYKTKIKL